MPRPAATRAGSTSQRRPWSGEERAEEDDRRLADVSPSALSRPSPLRCQTAPWRVAAARPAKGLISEVAGEPGILVVPDLEAGNIVAKLLVHLAGAEDAGLVLGARVPILLTSRADDAAARIASAALAQLSVHGRGRARRLLPIGDGKRTRTPQS